MKPLMICCGALGFALVATTAAAQVTTSQYDNLRTGATLGERILTPQNVNAKEFGKLGAFKVDGAVYAQPLFVPALEIPGKGRHDVLFVATEHDTVYAFDAGRPGDAPLWQVSLLDEKGETPVPARDVQCPFIQPEVGITSTPVIDIKTGTLFVLARTMIAHTLSKNQYFQTLHALAITTGLETIRPQIIEAAALGKGAGSQAGRITFDPLRENSRAALLLAPRIHWPPTDVVLKHDRSGSGPQNLPNTLYLAWGSSCDVDPYHGWVMAYDPGTLRQLAVINVTPDGSQGGIWMSDTGPAADASGNVYVPTGNGTFDASTPKGRDYGDTLLKLGVGGPSIMVRDYFTPHDQQQMSDSDSDLGSSGPLLLPDMPPPHPRLVLQPTKGGAIYLIDRDNITATPTPSCRKFPCRADVTARLRIGISTCSSPARTIICVITRF